MGPHYQSHVDILFCPFVGCTLLLPSLPLLLPAVPHWIFCTATAVSKTSALSPMQGDDEIRIIPSSGAPPTTTRSVADSCNFQCTSPAKCPHRPLCLLAVKNSQVAIGVATHLQQNNVCEAAVVAIQSGLCIEYFCNSLPASST